MDLQEISLHGLLTSYPIVLSVSDVRLGNSLSQPISVLSGVPQGSVIGPTLFLLFVNDVIDVLITLLFRSSYMLTILNCNRRTDGRTDRFAIGLSISRVSMLTRDKKSTVSYRQPLGTPDFRPFSAFENLRKRPPPPVIRRLATGLGWVHRLYTDMSYTQYSCRPIVW